MANAFVSIQFDSKGLFNVENHVSRINSFVLFFIFLLQKSNSFFFYISSVYCLPFFPRLDTTYSNKICIYYVDFRKISIISFYLGQTQGVTSLICWLNPKSFLKTKGCQNIWRQKYLISSSTNSPHWFFSCFFFLSNNLDNYYILIIKYLTNFGKIPTVYLENFFFL